ncbi:MAG: Oxygen-insensitive NAD(P)H nitroreductase (EC / Dihydropteridine reductase (EC [uncultured Campylobacterales bacterium]|uniref:Oxygen-insensitive NAD(P)H nitroreductase ) n=1 Tax=uncultured Campylobacterales bacterium TaxID=352960 RepID=A0A6S6T4L5_9BACT|nr:MAG: Oxygen-insensitive NAD(P)H nitroreductase (EC / Dihydropteridine reductase (EC [uncultured Campylobacterales bacterium]
MDFLEIQNFRHACKIFDTNKKISTSDFDYILECARLSPSSFGMQPWKLIVIEDEKRKEDIKPLCWNQAQITSCSQLVIIVANKDIVEPTNPHVKNMFRSRGLPQDAVDNYIKLYTDFIESTRQTTGIYNWVSKQCYILLANIMNAAASLKIDSCPIEGFHKEKLEKYLELDTSKEEISVVSTFGYRVNEAPEKIRLDINKIVKR